MEYETQLCPVCEKADLISRTTTETFRYKGTEFTLEDVEYSECPHCQAEVVTSSQNRRDEPRIRDEHRKIDGLLTRTEIVSIREQLGLSKSQAATIFGGREDDWIRYECGEDTQSVALDKLMRLAVEIPATFERLVRMSNLPDRVKAEVLANHQENLWVELAQLAGPLKLSMTQFKNILVSGKEQGMDFRILFDLLRTNHYHGRQSEPYFNSE